MDDKREGPRQRVLKSGKIVFAGGSFSVDCTIRNMSASGARLQVPTTVAIPDRFTLVDVQARIRREATVVFCNPIGAVKRHLFTFFLVAFLCSA